MNQVSLEENELVESYTILKHSRITLKEIFNKVVGEGEGTRMILNTFIMKNPVFIE